MLPLRAILYYAFHGSFFSWQCTVVASWTFLLPSQAADVPPLLWSAKKPSGYAFPPILQVELEKLTHILGLNHVIGLTLMHYEA